MAFMMLAQLVERGVHTRGREAGRAETLIETLGKAIGDERSQVRVAHRDIDAAAQIARLRALARTLETWDLSDIDLFDLARSLRDLYRAARRLEERVGVAAVASVGL